MLSRYFAIHQSIAGTGNSSDDVSNLFSFAGFGVRHPEPPGQCGFRVATRLGLHHTDKNRFKPGDLATEPPEVLQANLGGGGIPVHRRTARQAEKREGPDLLLGNVGHA